MSKSLAWLSTQSQLNFFMLLVWTVVCSKTSTDRDTNNISLFEVLEQLNGQVPPEQAGQQGLLAFSLEVVSLWIRSDANVPERGTGRLVHVDADASEYPPVEFTVDLTEHKRMRTLVQIGGLRVRRSGTHVMRIDFQHGEEPWATVAAVPLDVNLVVGAGGAANPAADPGQIH
jgi:hypothetical protein